MQMADEKPCCERSTQPAEFFNSLLVSAGRKSPIGISDNQPARRSSKSEVGCTSVVKKTSLLALFASLV
jgi:hypothetical protein